MRRYLLELHDVESEAHAHVATLQIVDVYADDSATIGCVPTHGLDAAFDIISQVGKFRSSPYQPIVL